ncbi:MAG: SDR family oxidoreductase [Acidimicrobiaceae bacterium]|nr:SDR family oxidoreductase [Acidimicrobiaceae bacterium]
MSLEGKTAIVTGASHPRGMGAAVAAKLAGLGATVALVDLESTADELAERAAGIVASGGRAGAVHADATDGDSVQSCVATVVEQLGPPEILVNNAGVGIGSHQLLENSEEIWSQTLAVNLMGVNRFSCAVIPHMQAAGGGVIVNNSSMSGLGAIAGIPPPYTASKHAVIGLTKAIALEFGPDNIRCVAICPGSVRTQLHARVMEMHMDLHGLSYEEAEELEVSFIPLGYSCEPEEVAGVVAFLVGPEGRYLTGVSIPIAGGMAPGL